MQQYNWDTLLLETRPTCRYFSSCEAEKLSLSNYPCPTKRIKQSSHQVNKPQLVNYFRVLAADKYSIDLHLL